MTLVSIGMALYDKVCAQTLVSLLATIQYRRTFDVHLNIVRGTYLHQSRALLVDRAHAAGASHLLFVDADMMFPADTVERLLAHQRPIVGVTYNTRTNPTTSTIKPLAMPSGVFTLPDTVFEVAALGTGLLLLDLAALAVVPKPWFGYGTTPSGEFVGEDIYFCHRARAAGLSVWCDPTIAVGHIGERIF